MKSSFWELESLFAQIGNPKSQQALERRAGNANLGIPFLREQ